MELVSKKCDVCGVIESGKVLSTWYGFCRLPGGVYVGGKLADVNEHVATLPALGLEINECCGQLCATKAAASIHSGSPTVKTASSSAGYEGTQLSYEF